MPLNDIGRFGFNSPVDLGVWKGFPDRLDSGNHPNHVPYSAEPDDEDSRYTMDHSGILDMKG